MTVSLSVFDISGRAMSAQLTRLNAVASNLANAGSTASSEAAAYRAMRPVFRTVGDGSGVATVVADRIAQTGTPERRHEPGHPLADGDGNVWSAAVDPTAELVEMLEASRQYRNNVQVIDTAKSLMLDTLRLGQ